MISLSKIFLSSLGTALPLQGRKLFAGCWATHRCYCVSQASFHCVRRGFSHTQTTPHSSCLSEPCRETQSTCAFLSVSKRSRKSSLSKPDSSEQRGTITVSKRSQASDTTLCSSDAPVPDVPARTNWHKASVMQTLSCQAVGIVSSRLWSSHDRKEQWLFSWGDSADPRNV